MKNLVLSGILFFLFCFAASAQSGGGKLDTLMIGGKTVSHLKVNEGDFVIFENKFYRIVISNETIKQSDWKFERENFIIYEGLLKSANENNFKIEPVPYGEKPAEPKIKKNIDDYPLIGE